MTRLSEILDEAISQSATDDLSTDWDGIREETEDRVRDLFIDLINSVSVGTAAEDITASEVGLVLQRSAYEYAKELETKVRSM